jgi:hypothetical protein
MININSDFIITINRSLLIYNISIDEIIKNDLKIWMKDSHSETMVYYYANLYMKKNKTVNRGLLIKYLKTYLFRFGTKLYSRKYYNELISKENYSMNDILNGHKSYAERNINENYYSDLKDYINYYSCIIDIGCGLNPILFLLKDKQFNCKYIAVDKDDFILDLLCKCIKKFDLEGITPFNCNIAKLDNKINTLFKSHYDFALVQKLIPSLSYSHNRKALKIISEIQCKYLLITGSIDSLSRNKSIYEKEKASIDAFVTRYGFIKVSDFNKPNEFGWIVKRK